MYFGIEFLALLLRQMSKMSIGRSLQWSTVTMVIVSTVLNPTPSQQIMGCSIDPPVGWTAKRVFPSRRDKVPHAPTQNFHAFINHMSCVPEGKREIYPPRTIPKPGTTCSAAASLMIATRRVVVARAKRERTSPRSGQHGQENLEQLRDINEPTIVAAQRRDER